MTHVLSCPVPPIGPLKEIPLSRTSPRRLRQLIGVGGTTLGAVLVLVSPALAHEPVLLDRTDVVPWVGPLLLDGTDPLNLIGTLPRAGAVRSAQFAMQAGQQVNVSLVIPDQAPENTLKASQLPRIFVISPTGDVTVVSATMRVPITPEGRSLLVLSTYSAPAEQGTYSLVVSGAAPSRFLVSMGQEGGTFGGIKRGGLASEEQFDEWYATAP
jgi:hypothetical protein